MIYFGTDGWDLYHQIVTVDKWTLFQVMAWCHHPLPEPVLTRISNAMSSKYNTTIIPYAFYYFTLISISSFQEKTYLTQDKSIQMLIVSCIQAQHSSGYIYALID